MTSRDFCYWLMGFIEVGNPSTLTIHQLELIKKHLALVFHHEIDPSFGQDQEALETIHSAVTDVDLATALKKVRDEHESLKEEISKPKASFGPHTKIMC